MENSEIAARLAEIAALMEFDGEPFFKTKAYERAARSVEDAGQPVRDMLAAGTIETLAGVGSAIAKKIDAIQTTGTCKYLEELRAKFPPTIVELLSVPGIGAKTAISLYQELGIAGIDDLRKAVAARMLVKIPRLGPKTIASLESALARMSFGPRRMRLGQAWELSHAIARALRESGTVNCVAVAGSVRRMEPTVGDLDIICTSPDATQALEAFSALPMVARVSQRGISKGTIVAGPGISVDCRVVPDRCFGNLLQHFTGSKEHNVKLREYAKRRGLKVSENGIEDRERRVVTATEEAAVYEALGMQFIPPELRVGLDEIDLARKHAIPELVALGDIRGELHAHTDWSDGRRSIEEMARAAAQRGREYLSISDHSQGRSVAGGLTAARLQEHTVSVRSASEKYGVRLFASSEVDIRADGSMDFPDEVLRQLDIVVGSIHSGFAGSKDKQTRRLLRAIANPYVNIVGHPTGAILEGRAGYEFDADAVFEAAARNGTALEINANPARLDLNAALARRAFELGCTIAIDSDAHDFEDMDNLRFGVGTARKAGLTKAAVLNTRSADDVMAFVRAKRDKGESVRRS
ncbi:MAG: DNA polymerase/3'-5' exonuclease PolX [Candidatus Eremiobacteraeota bacterium]|nr:DNA polymerase/3'-5' exonuclease PolX [Candidatus Eremiobacteraeota bacterium]MBC5827682.1 DNA polymerase/3'-5' exonuclease PolX [Candidatus Eremiobacteraeota bacterium]